MLFVPWCKLIGLYCGGKILLLRVWCLLLPTPLLLAASLCVPTMHTYPVFLLCVPTKLTHHVCLLCVPTTCQACTEHISVVSPSHQARETGMSLPLYVDGSQNLR